MHRSVLACSLLALAASIPTPVAGQSTDQGSGQGTRQMQSVLGRAVFVEGENGNGAYVTPIAKPASQAFDALQLTYATLKIPVTTLDPNQGLVGTTQWTMPHWFAGHELSRYFDCGAGRGQSADEASVKLTIRSTVKPDSSAGGSSLTTTVSVTASDPAQMTHNRPCQSTGALETRVSDELAKTLAK